MSEQTLQHQVLGQMCCSWCGQNALDDPQVSTAQAGMVLPLVVERQTLLLSVLHSRKRPASPIASINITDPQTARMTSEFPRGRCAAFPLLTAGTRVRLRLQAAVSATACRPAVAVTCAAPVWQGGTSMHMECYKGSSDRRAGPPLHRKLLEDRSHIYIGINMLVVPSGLTPTRVSHLVIGSKHTCAHLVDHAALLLSVVTLWLALTKSTPSQQCSPAIDMMTSPLPRHRCAAAMLIQRVGCGPRLLIGCWVMAPARSSAPTPACR